jgi:hypothetical protein
VRSVVRCTQGTRSVAHRMSLLKQASNQVPACIALLSEIRVALDHDV